MVIIGQTFTNLTDGDISKVVNTKTAVAIYEELIARINENAVDYKRAGVPKTDDG